MSISNENVLILIKCNYSVSDSRRQAQATHEFYPDDRYFIVHTSPVRTALPRDVLSTAPRPRLHGGTVRTDTSQFTRQLDHFNTGVCALVVPRGCYVHAAWLWRGGAPV